MEPHEIPWLIGLVLVAGAWILVGWFLLGYIKGEVERMLQR